MTDVPARLAPLLAQLDTSLSIGLDRLVGLTDDEFLWSPSPGAATVAPDARGRLRPALPPEDGLATRSIAALLGHLAEMAVLRADWTDGEHRLDREDVDWPATAAEGLAAVRDGWGCWRSAVAGLADDELDVVGRCAFPHGLDRDLPVLDIVWWMNRELIHHLAEAAFVRDLYATRSATAG